MYICQNLKVENRKFLQLLICVFDNNATLHTFQIQRFINHKQNKNRTQNMFFLEL